MDKYKSFHVVVKFETSPDEIVEIKKAVKDFFEIEVSKMKGFISAKFHENKEQTTFLNYASWESAECLENFRTVTQTSELAKKVLQFNPESIELYHIDL